jgi:D-alanine--poly(phosphoribitol) ligase subunit 2
MTPPLIADADAARNEIRAKVLELARRRGIKASNLRDDEVIPETGLLDSAAIMELIVWLETRFDVVIDQGDLTIENFGTVDAMVGYVTRAVA